MKCHIQIDAKLQNCVLFGIDKQEAFLGFEPYRSGTTLNNQKRRKPLKLIDWTGTITPISLLLRFSSSNSVEQHPWPHVLKFSFWFKVQSCLSHSLSVLTLVNIKTTSMLGLWFFHLSQEPSGVQYQQGFLPHVCGMVYIETVAFPALSSLTLTMQHSNFHPQMSWNTLVSSWWTDLMHRPGKEGT